MRGGESVQHKRRDEPGAKRRAGSRGVAGNRRPRPGGCVGGWIARNGRNRNQSSERLTMDSRTENTWFTNRYSQKRSPRPSSLVWSMGESSSTEHSVEPGTRAVFSTRRARSSSSASTEILTRWRRLGPTSPRIRIGYASFETTSKTSRPYWNDSGLRRWQESFSTLEFPHPNLMKRIEASLTESEAPSTCEWIRPVERRPTTW